MDFSALPAHRIAMHTVGSLFSNDERKYVCEYFRRKIRQCMGLPPRHRHEASISTNSFDVVDECCAPMTAQDGIFTKNLS